jgi:hypothetical protein
MSMRAKRHLVQLVVFLAIAFLTAFRVHAQQNPTAEINTAGLLAKYRRYTNQNPIFVAMHIC